MQFPEEFFKAEEREGFLVEEMMKRAWAAQLEVLEEVSRVCRNLGIRWYADSGTLLGAVRHKGFIPWDDDIDIQMTRKDYNRFIKEAAKRLPKGYVCISIHSNPNFSHMLARISNLTKPDFSDEIIEKYHGFPYPCGLDITPVDYIPRDPEQLSLFNALIDMALVLANIYEKNAASDQEKEEGLKKVEEFTGLKVNRNEHIPQQLRIIAEKICGMYTTMDSDVMGYAIRQKNRPEYNWPKEVYRRTVDLPFENITIPAAEGYEDILRNQYGADYMTPKQIFGHDYPFYKQWL